MNFNDLKNLLRVNGQGELMVAKGSLGAAVDTLINTCYANRYNNNQLSIVLRGAAVTVKANTINVTGKSEFLNTNLFSKVAALNVAGTFSLDDKGEVQLILRYALPSPASWKFSNSFACLPPFTDWSKPVNVSAVQLLDELCLSDSAFVVSTQTRTDTLLKVPLEPGINFVSWLKPQGILGALKSSFNQGERLPVYGRIVPPQAGQIIEPRVPFGSPWEKPTLDVDGIPGILLTIELAKVKLGDSSFDDFKLCIYSPIDSEWLEQNPTHTPLASFTGALTISEPCASNLQGIKIDLVADYEVGANEVYLTGIGQGLSIANLADMCRISGPGDHYSALPADLEPLVKTLSQIELQRVGLGLSIASFPPKITSSMFAIGLSSVNWPIWEDHFALTGLSCQFEVDNPFDSDTREIEVTLAAKTEVEGAEVDIFASSREQFAFYASLADVDIPIKSLLKNFSLDVTPPSDLHINSLRVCIAPMKSYSFALFMAAQPNAWIIDLGSNTLEISDVTLSLAYPAGGPVMGNFAGTIDLTSEKSDHEISVTVWSQLSGVNGWQFEGSTGTGQEIPIGKLLEDLAGKFGVTKPELPSALVDLTVKNLSVSFNTQRKDFKFTCEADLPTSAQSSLVIELVIDVKHDDQGACQFELSGQFDVHMDSVTKLEFKLQFEHGGKTDKLIAAYHHEGKLRLNVSALLKALAPGDNDLTNLIAGLDIAVDLKDVQLAFYKESAESSKPAKSLFGMLLNAEVSFSDPASHTNEKLVAGLNSVLFASFERASANLNDGQKATSKFLFGLKIGAELSVANLPLIGKDLPLEQPVGVKDLQLFVASQAILPADMEQVNNLLGADKIPSPMKEEDAGQSENVLEYGVTLNATLLLGAGSRTLVLVPSGSKSPAGEGLQNENAAESNKSIISGTNQPEGQGTAPTALVTSQVPTPSVKWIKIEKSFGPIRFDRIGFQFQDQVIWFLLDASLAAAGLTLSFDGLGFGSKITQFEPQFDLRGLGIDYRNGPLQIGGAFLKQEFTTGNTKYTAFGGLAVIRTETLSISAIGSYANLNGCSSLFIYAVLDYPLGGPPFFYVTGLVAGFGYNRRLNLPTVDNIATFPLVEEATREGGPPQLPAGKDAQQETLTQELTKLESYIPFAAGQNFLVAGVKFTSFKMIDSFALLAVSFGEHLEIDILGISTIKAPFSADKKAHCLAEIQIAFKASFIPAEGFLGVIAQLTSSSYILSRDCQLTGGMAFYSWFSGKHAGDFVLTVGGYHSKFKVPAHYPQVPALAINWQVSSNLSIKGDAYFALTPSALMAGGHLAATWHSGPIKAWFTAGADFLIAWKPFHYDATISVGMGVSYTYWFFGTRHITVELGADLHIWGPEFSGVARIHLWIISFDISFGAPASPSPEKIEWPEFQASFLPEQILTVSVKDGLISASSSSDNLGVVNPKDFSLVVDSFIPVRNLNGVAATYQDQASGAQVPGANFGIAPMSMSDLATDLKISLTEDGKPCKDEQGKDRFKLTSVTKNVPAGLWGAKLPLGLDSDSLVKDVISGVEIVPACQPEPVGKKEMDASDLQSTSEIKELHGQEKMDFLLLVDRSKVDQSQDTTRRQVIQDSLRRPNQKRQKMLEDLGLKDVNITISEQIADVFMVAPQIEQ